MFTPDLSVENKKLHFAKTYQKLKSITVKIEKVI